MSLLHPGIKPATTRPAKLRSEQAGNHDMTRAGKPSFSDRICRLSAHNRPGASTYLQWIQRFFRAGCVVFPPLLAHARPLILCMWGRTIVIAGLLRLSRLIWERLEMLCLPFQIPNAWRRRSQPPEVSGRDCDSGCRLPDRSRTWILLIAG